MKSIIGFNYAPQDNSWVIDLQTKIKSSLIPYRTDHYYERKPREDYVILDNPYVETVNEVGLDPSRHEFINVVDPLSDKAYRVLYYPTWVIKPKPAAAKRNKSTLEYHSKFHTYTETA